MRFDIIIAKGIGLFMKRTFFLSFTTTVGCLVLGGGSTFGQDWAITTAPFNAWVAVATSADCSKIAAADSPGGIYYSVDSGSNWSRSDAPSSHWVSLASSTNGMLMTAVVNGGGIWTSTNSGVSWSITSAPSHAWAVVACSADGATISAGGLGGIWISTNSGAEWSVLAGIPSTADGTPATYYGLDCLANGAQLIALSDGLDGIDFWLGSGSGMEGYNVQWEQLTSAAQEDTLAGSAGNGVLIGSSRGFGFDWSTTLVLSTPPSAIGASPDGSRFVAFEGSSIM